MPICNYAGDPAMNSMFSSPKYLALMNADPTQAGTLANEMTGDGYVRKLVTFTSASGRSVNNYETVSWADLPTTPIRYIAVIDALTGGNMIAYCPTGSDIVIAEGYKYVIEAGDLSFTIT